MATAFLIEAPYSQFFDNNGYPLAGGTVLTQAAGTTTNQTTYTDSTGNTPAANPIVLDSAGRTAIWANVPLRISVFDSTGVLIRATDNVTPTGSAALNSITNAYLAPEPASTLKGNATGASTNPQDLTVSQVNTLLGTNVFTGDTGSGGTRGVVPAPAAGDAAAGKYLSASGAWAAPTSAIALISTTTLTAASANQTILTGFNGTLYYGYRFEVLDYRPATGATTLGFQLSINGGTSYLTSTGAAGFSCNGSTVTAINTVDTIGFGNFTSTAGFGNWAQIDIFQNNITTSNPSMNIQGVNNTNGAVGVTNYYYSQMGNAVGAVINGIKFTPSSGNITSGVIKMYGFLK